MARDRAHQTKVDSNKKKEIIPWKNNGDNNDYRYSDTNTIVDQPPHDNNTLRYGRSDIEDIIKALGENNDHHPFIWTNKCKL